LPEIAPEDPGPVAFADVARVRRLLDEAGFVEIDIRAENFDLDIALGEGLDSAVQIALELGPTSRMLEGQPETARAAAAKSVRAALAAYAEGDRVPLGAAVWFVTARNPA
jgi:hypothetical protein